MNKCLKLAISGALLGAMAASAVPTHALAGPMGVAPPATVSLSAPVDKVWYRRWGGGYGYRGYGGYRPYYGGYYRRYNPGAAVAAGVGLGLLGAGLAAANSSYYYGGYYPYYNYNYGYYPGYYYPGYYGGW
ncbi:MAG: hypothetical protein ACR652_22765 [Methylocystis sp.]|uniref:hypothetical protein n=1 Tax=Methylocystis sp. TaxID=1911079 RepID=UPI003DA28228